MKATVKRMKRQAQWKDTGRKYMQMTFLARIYSHILERTLKTTIGQQSNWKMVKDLSGHNAEDVQMAYEKILNIIGKCKFK